MSEKSHSLTKRQYNIAVATGAVVTLAILGGGAVVAAQTSSTVGASGVPLSYAVGVASTFVAYRSSKAFEPLLERWLL